MDFDDTLSCRIKRLCLQFDCQEAQSVLFPLAQVVRLRMANAVSDNALVGAVFIHTGPHFGIDWRMIHEYAVEESEESDTWNVVSFMSRDELVKCCMAQIKEAVLEIKYGTKRCSSQILILLFTLSTLVRYKSLSNAHGFLKTSQQRHTQHRTKHWAKKLSSCSV